MTASTKTQGSTPQTRAKRRKAMIILSIIFAVLAIAWLIHYLIWGQFEEYTDDAYVAGNIVQLMSQVSGTVIAIHGDDTQVVHSGDVVVQLDPKDTAIALQNAKTKLAQTVRQVNRYFEQALQAQAQVKLRAADLAKAKEDVSRRVGLVGERAISREELQHYRTTLDVSQAQYDIALHQMRTARALVENATLYSHPLVESAKANLRHAYLNHARTTILAPVTGIIAKRTIQVGQQIAPNTPLLAIIPLGQVWVDANYKESQLANICAGQPVTLYADAYPDMTYHGKVAGLNAGTGAAFSLLPPQNATGNWIKIVQRLPVRINLDADELKQQPLQIGLSMRVTTNIHRLDHPTGNKTSKPTQYLTRVYAAQLQHAEALINAILKANAKDVSFPKSEASA